MAHRCVISMTTWALEVEIWAGKSRLLSILLPSAQCNAGNYVWYFLDWAVLIRSRAQTASFNSPMQFEHLTGISSGAPHVKGLWRGWHRVLSWGSVTSLAGDTDAPPVEHREKVQVAPPEYHVCWLRASSREIQVISSFVLTGYQQKQKHKYWIIKTEFI